MVRGLNIVRSLGTLANDVQFPHRLKANGHTRVNAHLLLTVRSHTFLRSRLED
jgi:hypothetical protein